ncbi:MAG: beta-lactamase family protein [Flavobacteriaceae bacterium]|jgi:CubicO group peptidase (beta-lactamase class C family)|nr:beta-lactamase family protein [Flavobacteriaceae bacterium]
MQITTYFSNAKALFLTFFGVSLILLISCKTSDNYQINALQKHDIDALINHDTKKPFNGIILITKNNEIVYSKIQGYSDIENKIPLKKNDQFIIGSVSKQFTAVIVLQEYDKGHLDLFSPIRKYLPELTQSWADTITVHHLLTHTHGIIAPDQPTKFKAGSQYEYSQIGYGLLAKIVEKTSGKTFIKLSEELFKSCNMHHTFHPDLHYDHLVKGYIEDEEGKLHAYPKEYWIDFPVAAGTFISTAEDLALWDQNLFNGKLLKETTFQMMVSKHQNAIRNHPVFGITEYGYGITVDDKKNFIVWGQTGLIPGYVSMNFYYPQTDTSVIVLENINYDTKDLKKTFYYHTQILDIIRKSIQNL